MGSKFPFLCVKGTNYDMGHQIGRNLKDLIQRFIYFIIGDLPLEKAKNRAAAFIPVFEAHCPHLLEEIQGISDGAEISLEEAMLRYKAVIGPTYVDVLLTKLRHLRGYLHGSY